MLSFVCISVLCLTGALAVSPDNKRDDSGFQLFVGTQAPQLPNSGGVDLNCVDKQANCVAFGKQSCQPPYDKWAKDNCANFCGFCQGPTTPAPACVDKIQNCEAYGQTVCNDPQYGTWAVENCRYFCRKCTVQQLQVADSMTTTIAPERCVDKVDCRLYGKSSCSGNFKGWANENCMNYCGFCVGVPTPPPACVDKINNCDQYDPASCTDAQFHIWATDNCRKHCNLCSGGAGSAGVTPSLQNPVPATSMPGYAVPNFPGKRNIPPLRSVKRQAGTGAEPNGLMTEKPPTTLTSTESPPSTKAPTTLEPPPALPVPEHEGTGAEIVEPAFPPKPIKTTTEKGPAPPSTTTIEAPPPTTTENPPDTPTSTEMGPTTTEMAPDNNTTENMTDSTTPSPSSSDNTTDSAISTPSASSGPDMTTDSGVPTQSPSGTDMTTDSGVPTQSPVGTDMTTDSGVPTQSPGGTDMTTDSGVPTQPPSGTDMTTDSGVPTQSPNGTDMTTDSGVPTQPPSGTDMTTDSGVPTQSPSGPDTTMDSGVPTPSNGPVTTTELPGSGSTEVPSGGSTEKPATGTTEEPATGPTQIPDTTSPSATPLGPVTIAPSATTAAVTAPSGVTEVCEDKLPNCRQYGFDKVCSPGPYRPWAEVRCRKFCGFCGAPTTPPPCQDVLPNCAEYNDDLCSNPIFKIFREDNCRAFCKLCDNPLAPPTTQPVSTTPDAIMQSLKNNCRNIRTDCDYFQDTSCFNEYESWARRNCALRCGYCPGKEEPCQDTDPLCSEYGADLCTGYEGFARDKCRKFCNLCGNPVPPSSIPGSSNSTGTARPFPPSGQPNLKPTSANNLTAASQILSHTYEGPPSDIPGFCQYKDQYLNLTQTYKDGCDVRCTCLDNIRNTVVCTDVCPTWTSTPSECHLEKVAGECCDRLICSGDILPGVPQVNPTQVPVNPT